MSALSGWPFPSHVAAGFPVALKLVSVLLLSATRDENLQIDYSGLETQTGVTRIPKLGFGGGGGLKNELPFVILIIIKYRNINRKHTLVSSSLVTEFM